MGVPGDGVEGCGGVHWRRTTAGGRLLLGVHRAEGGFLSLDGEGALGWVAREQMVRSRCGGPCVGIVMRAGSMMKTTRGCDGRS